VTDPMMIQLAQDSTAPHSTHEMPIQQY